MESLRFKGAYNELSHSKFSVTSSSVSHFIHKVSLNTSNVSKVLRKLIEIDIFIYSLKRGFLSSSTSSLLDVGVSKILRRSMKNGVSKACSNWVWRSQTSRIHVRSYVFFSDYFHNFRIYL